MFSSYWNMIQQVGNVSWKQIKENTYSYRISSKWINMIQSNVWHDYLPWHIWNEYQYGFQVTIMSKIIWEIQPMYTNVSFCIAQCGQWADVCIIKQQALLLSSEMLYADSKQNYSWCESALCKHACCHDDQEIDTYNFGVVSVSDGIKVVSAIDLKTIYQQIVWIVHKMQQNIWLYIIVRVSTMYCIFVLCLEHN